MAKKLLKLPPSNVEAEQSVIGALMLDKNAIINVADILQPDDFYTPANAKIYETILELYAKSQPIDILSVSNRLKEKEYLQDIGGSTYVSKLIDGVPTASHVAYYANLVKEKKIMRDLIHASAKITEKAFDVSGNLDETLDEIERSIFGISQRAVPQKFVLIKDELPKAYERVEKLHRGEKALGGLGTGFIQLDNITSGLRPSDMIVIGARPSLGKTSLALDIARHVALNEKVPVGIFSLEMSRDQLVDRLLSAVSGVPLWKLRTGRLSDEADFELLQAGLDKLSGAPIFIEDNASPNILEMRSMARRLQAEHGLGLLVIDYLQLIQPRTKSDNVVQQVTEVSRGIKGLARELNIPVIALSQLSRNVEQRETGVPRLADLRESGSIEQDSDLVMFISRKDKTKTNLPPEEENCVEIHIAKHRNGPLGMVKLKFDSDRVSFQNIDTAHTNAS
ncbi:MAG: replicative DNA helicase [Parcubacteria group bacterium Gr01-1014_3]|nr:MAG: replicative DNA helicase [Parcubacteria group bacterium Gr01-1014_3]